MRNEHDAHRALLERAQRPRPQIIDPPVAPPLSWVSVVTWAAVVVCGVGALFLLIALIVATL
jgi:hypothetical protein